MFWTKIKPFSFLADEYFLKISEEGTLSCANAPAATQVLFQKRDLHDHVTAIDNSNFVIEPKSLTFQKLCKSNVLQLPTFQLSNVFNYVFRFF